ncbi:hypothetical protein CLAFUW4_10669 [Fulvia fulva]|nr:hypothetical protein CLAFUR4_10674 [Fulvia fulva]WPV19320.1 hypothetical protein CLAFUW4_10669 [Fulvia fulva]WPV34426.1 hypothetical protein CLAFUW7_10671 [Fulvia fulva]
MLQNRDAVQAPAFDHEMRPFQSRSLSPAQEKPTLQYIRQLRSAQYTQSSTTSEVFIMVTYKCAGCEELFEKEEVVWLIPGQHDTSVCLEQCAPNLADQFRTAIKSEQIRPPAWGGYYIPVAQLEPVLGADFVQRYNMELEERKTLLKLRRCCRVTDAQTGKECGAYIGQAKRGPTGEPSKYLCRECWTEACVICGAPLIPESGNLLDHECSHIEPQCKSEVIPIDGAVQGEDYQYCPHSQCGQIIQLMDGCNAVQCIQRSCHTQFCLCCGQKALHKSNHWRKRPGGCPRFGKRSAKWEMFDPVEAYPEDQGQPEIFAPWPTRYYRAKNARLRVTGPVCDHDGAYLNKCAKCDEDDPKACGHLKRSSAGLCVDCGKNKTVIHHRMSVHCGWFAERLSAYLRRNFIGVHPFNWRAEHVEEYLGFEYTSVPGQSRKKIGDLVFTAHEGNRYDPRSSIGCFLYDLQVLEWQNQKFFVGFLCSILNEWDWDGTEDLAVWAKSHGSTVPNDAKFVEESSRPGIEVFPDTSPWLDEDDAISWEIDWNLFIQHIRDFSLGRQPVLANYLSWIEPLSTFKPGDLNSIDLNKYADIRLELDFVGGPDDERTDDFLYRLKCTRLKSLDGDEGRAAYVALCNRIIPLFANDLQGWEAFVRTLRIHYTAEAEAMPQPFLVKGEMVVEEVFVLKAPTEDQNHFELIIPMGNLDTAYEELQRLHPNLQIAQKFDHIHKEEEDDKEPSPLYPRRDEDVHLLLSFGEGTGSRNETVSDGHVIAVHDAWYTRNGGTYKDPPAAPEFENRHMSTEYNKKSGKLRFDGDKRKLFWTCDTDETNVLSISITSIKTVQKLPAGSKRGLRLLMHQGSDKHYHTFWFTDEHNADTDLWNIKALIEDLSRWQKAKKNGGHLVEEEAWLKDSMKSAVIEGSSVKFWDAMFTRLRRWIARERMAWVDLDNATRKVKRDLMPRQNQDGDVFDYLTTTTAPSTQDLARISSAMAILANLSTRLAQLERDIKQEDEDTQAQLEGLTASITRDGKVIGERLAGLAACMADEFGEDQEDAETLEHFLQPYHTETQLDSTSPASGMEAAPPRTRRTPLDRRQLNNRRQDSNTPTEPNATTRKRRAPEVEETTDDISTIANNTKATTRKRRAPEVEETTDDISTIANNTKATTRKRRAQGIEETTDDISTIADTNNTGRKLRTSTIQQSMASFATDNDSVEDLDADPYTIPESSPEEEVQIPALSRSITPGLPRPTSKMSNKPSSQSSVKSNTKASSSYKKQPVVKNTASIPQLGATLDSIRVFEPLPKHPTIIKNAAGDWVELRCCECKGNYSLTTKKFFNGVNGLRLHLRKSHTLDKGVLTDEKIINACTFRETTIEEVYEMMRHGGAGDLVAKVTFKTDHVGSSMYTKSRNKKQEGKNDWDFIAEEDHFLDKYGCIVRHPDGHWIEICCPVCKGNYDEKEEEFISIGMLGFVAHLEDAHGEKIVQSPRELLARMKVRDVSKEELEHLEVGTEGMVVAKNVSRTIVDVKELEARVRDEGA